MTAAAARVRLLPPEVSTVKLPEAIPVSEWCDRHRVLTPESGSPRLGPWRTSVTPYLRGILDAYGDPRCSEMVLMGATQWGKTETLINCLLYSVANDPLPMVFVLATEEDCVSFAERRLKPAIDGCAPCAQQKSERKRDWKEAEVSFCNGAWLRFAWPGSPARLAMWATGRLFLDEVDKYPAWSGREADPISLARERTRWFPDAKVVISSTPTTEEGNIWRAWLLSDQRRYWVPCPLCGAFQVLRFSRETVIWPEGERDPAKIRRHRLARYVCEHCAGEIADTDRNRQEMLAAGTWCPEGGAVDASGQVVGAALDADVRGFHVNAMVSPVLSWSDVAAQFLHSRDDSARLMNFRNSWDGLPWVQRTAALTIDRLRTRELPTLPAGTVPREVVALTAGADVQEREVYYAVRAHLGSDRSVTVYAGRLDSLDSLADVLARGSWPVDGDPRRRMRVRLACVDSGYRTDAVYRTCGAYHDVLRPTKGHQHLASPFTAAKIERDWIGHAVGLLLWHVDTSYFKDRLARKMSADMHSPGSWHVHAAPSEEYLRHLCSEHRVLVTSKKSRRATEEWTPRPGGGPNHWLDAEVLAEVAHDMLGLYAVAGELPALPASRPSTLQERREAQDRQGFRARVREAQGRGWIRRRKGRE